MLDYHTSQSFPGLERVLQVFGEGLSHYRVRDFYRAAAAFEQAMQLNPDDGASRMYRDRCRYFISKPPPADWDGVWTMTSK